MGRLLNTALHRRSDGPQLPSLPAGEWKVNFLFILSFLTEVCRYGTRTPVRNSCSSSKVSAAIRKPRSSVLPWFWGWECPLCGPLLCNVLMPVFSSSVSQGLGSSFLLIPSCRKALWTRVLLNCVGGPALDRWRTHRLYTKCSFPRPLTYIYFFKYPGFNGLKVHAKN